MIEEYISKLREELKAVQYSEDVIGLALTLNISRKNPDAISASELHNLLRHIDVKKKIPLSLQQNDSVHLSRKQQILVLLCLIQFADSNLGSPCGLKALNSAAKLHDMLLTEDYEASREVEQKLRNLFANITPQ